MAFEEPKKEQKNSEQYRAEALVIAQRMSHQWKKLDGKLLPENPRLSEIYQMTHPPKTGIQIWFDSQVNFIVTAAGNSEETKSKMMYRLKGDLEQLEKDFNEIVR